LQLVRDESSAVKYSTGKKPSSTEATDTSYRVTPQKATVSASVDNPGRALLNSLISGKRNMDEPSASSPVTAPMTMPAPVHAHTSAASSVIFGDGVPQTNSNVDVQFGFIDATGSDQKTQAPQQASLENMFSHHVNVSNVPLNEVHCIVGTDE
jgi:hypothetical protein